MPRRKNPSNDSKFDGQVDSEYDSVLDVAAKDGDLVQMHREGEVAQVHPDSVAVMAALGWKSGKPGKA